MSMGAREPATLDLKEFLELLPFLEAADLMAISAAYRQADPDPRAAAREVAGVASKRARLADELDRLQGSIVQWATSDIARSGAFTMAEPRPNQMLGDLRVEAVPPLLDAATALLLADALSDDERAALLEPIGAAIG